MNRRSGGEAAANRAGEYVDASSQRHYIHNNEIGMLDMTDRETSQPSTVVHDKPHQKGDSMNQTLRAELKPPVNIEDQN